MLEHGACPVHGAAPTAPNPAPAFWEEDESGSEPTRELEGDRHLSPGSRLGEFSLGEPLGQGGQAIVYEATDRQGRAWALKVLTDDGELEALKAEARLAVQVKHRNVLRVERFVEHPRPFLVMERVSGPTVEAKLADGPLSWAAFKPIFEQTLSALEAIHAAGLVHRDLKPSNLMLAEDRLVLIDFGTARAHGGAVGIAPTRTGTVRGTLEFMSPEQLRGQPLDARTDLFSLGCTTWLALTGAFPWAGKGTATARARLERDADRLRVKGVPAAVVRLIEQLVARDRAARPGSASQVRAALW